MNDNAPPPADGKPRVMKAAHLKKIQARLDRATSILLPDEVARGEVTDPEDRLRRLITRIDGWPALPEGSSWRSAVRDIVQILETDVPAMIGAVREANAARYKAERDLSMRAGTRYTVTVSSDSPIAVTAREVVEPLREAPAEPSQEEPGASDAEQEEPSHGYWEKGDYR